MASTSSAFVRCASSSLSLPKRYEVFISFRGEDTRVDFTSHLHKALLDKGIDTYIDYKIEKGEQVWVELVKAIKDSTVFLVIFSENYASSSWCLNELVELMECKKQGEDNVHVIPVFYKVDPSHVRKQRGSYHAATANQKWKDALYNAANISGFHSNTYRTETDLIEGIIKAVSEKLNDKKYANDFADRFIYDENYRNIESLLKFDSKKVRVIGIWGMGGIGKTSLAAAIFHNVSSQYERTCFIENVAEESKRHGFNYLFNKLLSKLLMEDLNIDSAKVIPSFVTRRLRCKKVLIVLDDVNTSELVENLVGVGCVWLGAGSRVIVTTRDKHVLISGDVEKIYKVEQMNFQNSLKLFSLNAFRKNCPEEEYLELSKRAMAYAKGIPLALKVLGSFLHSKSQNEWDSALGKLKKIPDAKIQAVLRLSYDGLDDDEKNIFLDIACFFRGREIVSVTKVLNACGFYADIGIRNLLDKGLISINPAYDNCLDMHDLIQEMGRAIVREESIQNPGQRSRLWDPEEINDVLSNSREIHKVEGIWLQMTQITNININAEAFRKMPNLRLLALEPLTRDMGKINLVYLQKGLEFLPKKLRYFGWKAYPLESLPSTFCLEKLVVLSMPFSNVKKLWHGAQNFPKLVKLDLRGSKHLMECPNLSHAPNLRTLILCQCESLPYVDPSVFSLPKLHILDLKECSSITSLNSNTGSQSLKLLYLRDSGLDKQPPSSLHFKNLGLIIYSINYALADLPENFVRVLFLSESDSTIHEDDSFFILDKVLPSPGFRSLPFLLFENCQSLCRIPDNISLLSSLQFLIFHRCPIRSLPESIKYLPRLKNLEFYECEMLQCVFAIPQSVQRFLIWSCPSLQTVLCSTFEPSKTCERTFLLPNCTKLGEHSCDAILTDVIGRIELGTKPTPSAAVLENEEDESTDNNLLKSAKVCFPLPAGSGKVREFFPCHFTDASATIEQQLPANFLGFIFYLVVSPVQLQHIGCCRSIGCECYLETSPEEEKINITSIFLNKCVMVFHPPRFRFKADHVFLWYDAQCCKKIMEVINERRGCNGGDSKLSFKFFAQTPCNNGAVIIKECGFRWICSLQEEGRSKSKRGREGSEYNDQEETLPPTKKFKSGTSNLVAEETAELRHLLEELLHL